MPTLVDGNNTRPMHINYGPEDELHPLLSNAADVKLSAMFESLVIQYKNRTIEVHGTQFTVTNIAQLCVQGRNIMQIALAANNFLLMHHLIDNINKYEFSPGFFAPVIQTLMETTDEKYVVLHASNSRH